MKNLLENKMFKVFIGMILLVTLIFIAIIVLVSNKNKTLTELELKNAAKAYYEKYPGYLPKENYDSMTVTLSTLVTNGYISGDKDLPSCPTSVIVTNMNGTYDYTVVLNCNTAPGTTTSLMSKLTASMTNSGSGLYNENGKFIFRGENPNNYVKFGEELWRVIGFDQNNNIKLIYGDVYVKYNEWDDRYNSESDRDKGINDFIGSEKSRIKEYLDAYFTDKYNRTIFTAEMLTKTTKFDTCVGKVDIESGNTNICTETYNSRISTITIDDYINASLDPACNLNDTVNCRNYNFLNYDGWTINAYSSNTYQAYHIYKSKGLGVQDTYIRGAIRPVIALKNDVTYVSGSGTQTDPYIIK